MKFIKITEEIAVNKDEVEFITRSDDGGAVLRLRSGRTVKTQFLYKSLLDLIEFDDHDQVAEKLPQTQQFKRM